MKLWISGLKAILLVFGLTLLMPQPGDAIPAFARKYRSAGLKQERLYVQTPGLPDAAG